MSEATQGAPGALTGTVLSDRYRLDSKLGSGGMSTVYLARDETLERWVAVKVLHREISDQPDQLERFARESRTVAQVSHPNVVAVIDAGEDGGRPYIVFEYCDGETLKERIDRSGRLPLDEAAAYAIEVGRGLAAAHARRLVHRDVKPQNVLIDSEGRAKVTDFGIARSLESDGLTKTGRVLGTTDYVSPEQAMGHEVDAGSDIYSLGVLLYEMLTGDVPFKADNVVGVAMKHVNEKMPNVQKVRPQVSAALAAVLERSTEKDSRKRYRDMGEMLADLEAALEVEVARAGHSTGEATTVLRSVPNRRRRLLTRRNVSVAGILLVLLGGGAALIIAGTASDPEKRGGGGAASGSATGSEVEFTDADDFDPPPGDGEEHGDEVRLAVDGDPGTTWATETYTAGPRVEDATEKTGVGLILDADEPVDGANLVVDSPKTDWEGEVYAAASGPPSELAGWGEPVATMTGDQAADGVELTLPEDARYYLVWFTSLASYGEGFRAEIGSARLTSG